MKKNEIDFRGKIKILYGCGHVFGGFGVYTTKHHSGATTARIIIPAGDDLSECPICKMNRDKIAKEI